MDKKKSKVAILKCENYKKENVRRTMYRLLELLDFNPRNAEKILLKPNLCLSVSPEEALTTHPEIVSCLCEIFNKSNAKISVGDNPVGSADESRIEDVWKKTGFAEMVLRQGVTQTHLNHNLIKDSRVLNGEPYDIYFSKEISSFDTIINIAKFKTHSLMTFTGCIKNLYGMLAGDSKKLLHAQFFSRESFANLLLDVFHSFPCALHVMDAVYGIEGNGPGREGKKRYIGVLMASQDALALDLIAAKLTNINPYDVPTNYWGVQRNLGADLDHIEVLGNDIAPFIMNDYAIPNIFKFNEDVTERLFRFSKSHLEIDEKKCIGCELCRHNCPPKAISRNDTKMMIDAEKCICCMTCREICPSAAIQEAAPRFIQELKKIKNLKK
jgi:uncharacterized protein (DUF362 family)/Pyruvate/2-oxoacid:ferredoxin oxidoreductase delta subunit